MSKINQSEKVNILMIGPDRDVMGGISTVVNSYYDLGLDDKVNLKFIPTMKDGNKLRKLFVAIKAYVSFGLAIKKYDIVHVHMAAQASFTRKSLFVKKAKKAGKKIIIHQHSADFNVYFNEQCDETKRDKIKKIFSMADKILVLSEEWADFFGGNVCDREKIAILHNSVIVPEYKKIDYSDSNVLFLGRLGERKGTYDLLEAVPKVLDKKSDAVFYLGGDGDIERCSRIVKEKGIENSVKLLGWIGADDKTEYLKKCSTFILPSYHEGMPMSVLEAMSYGLAAISTNAGGIPQIIDDGVNGVRFEAGDVKLMTEALVDILSDCEKKRQLGASGRKTIEEHFSANAVVDKLVELYNDIV